MEDVYAANMTRNEKEAQRLDEQLELLNRNIGYLLHPSVTERLSFSPTVADVGTGTGLFLSQLAEHYPRATLRGFDISSELFPAPETLPANVTLQVMDVKSPPPPSEYNRYDVVHVRLLAAAMSSTDWEVAVRNIVQLLKPGGALQWEEGNFADVRHLRGNVCCSVSAARFMGSLFRENLRENFSYGWSTLPQILSTVGFVNIDEDIVSSDRVPETRLALTKNGMRAIFAWASNQVDRCRLGSLTSEELQALETQAYQDIESGCYVRFDIHVAVGFWPR